MIALAKSKEHVAPLVGAWIEIPLLRRVAPWLIVAPLVGAWIEIDLRGFSNLVRQRRSPCGSVD